VTRLSFREVSNDENYLLTDMDVGGFTFSVTALHKGKGTRGHQHPWPEVYIGLKGRGTLHLGVVSDFLLLAVGKTTPGDNWISAKSSEHSGMLDRGTNGELLLLQNGDIAEVDIRPGSRLVIPGGIYHQVEAHTEMEFACFFTGER
jgi:quercetin dioxygenase-like cupin family protein